MKIKEMLADKKSCIGCGNCSIICGTGACVLEQDEEGYWYPIINNDLCVRCKACTNVCPVMNNKASIKDYKNSTFCGYLTNTSGLLECASGGAATAISKMVLSKKGVVYGVAYLKDFLFAEHIRVESERELKLLKGSKYIQSRKNDTFISVLKDLRAGKLVGFFGVPCEVAALKLFLKHEYDNLLTCELICQGTMSEMVQKQFVRQIEKKFNSKVVDFSARSKKFGWIPPYIYAKFANGKEYYKMAHFTDYGEAHELMLRPSCYNCLFKGDNKVADITVGDAWGAKKGTDQWNEAGTSVLISHTPRGDKIINDCKEMYLTKISYEQILKSNPMLEKRWPMDDRRAAFSEMLQKKSLHYACRKTRSFSRGIKRLLNEVIPDELWMFIKKRK